MKEISRMTGINWLKIVRLFNHWQEAESKYACLSIAPGRGAKVKLNSVKALLPELIDKHSRNLYPILDELKTKHHTEVCKLTLQNFLKTLGYRWKRARLSLKSFHNQELFEVKQKQIESLMDLHKQGYLDVYFPDESHFGLTPKVPYAWQHKDKPILLPSKNSSRLTVWGLMSSDCKLKFCLTLGSMNSQNIISFIDDFCKTITKKTIIVLDNAPIHRSKLFKAKINEWKEQDLIVFFLTPYSPELNRIEILWRFIKYKWMPLNAFLNIQNLKERLNSVLENVGSKYIINFY